jgi:hypothetical protein
MSVEINVNDFLPESESELKETVFNCIIQIVTFVAYVSNYFYSATDNTF